MSKTKDKKITLNAYLIDNTNLKEEHSDLTRNLIEKLHQQKGKARERRMKLNSESTEEDILTDYSINANMPYVWGVMWRIAPTKDMPSIPEDLFENEKITTNDIKTEVQNANLCTKKDQFYFAVNNSHLVTNLPKGRVKSLQDYLNWFLTIERGEKLYSFTPMVMMPENNRLSEIKDIVIGNSKNVYHGTKEREENISLSNKVCNFAVDKLGALVNEMPELKTLMDNNILSARLVINFKKPRKMKEEDYSRMLGTFMKPISDDEMVAFKLKNGKKITGKELLMSRSIEVEVLDGGFLNEKSLMLDMEQFLKDLGE